MSSTLPLTSLGLGLAALVLLVAWLNARRLRLRNEALARLAEERAAALEGALRVAEEANAAKGDFLAVMSHELRTPVHAILGMTELLLTSPLAKEQQERARSVQRAARGLLGLVNDILDFSKMEAGKLSLRTVSFDLVELVEDLVDLHSAVARDKHLELILHWDGPEDRCRVGDPDRLRQILMNLLGNALKFTSHGYVRLKVEAQEGGLNWRFSVEDTGCGVHPDKQDLLFEPFTQEDTSITRRFGGTGLGLAICKRLVEGMGGRIGLESRQGQGSVFWVELDLPSAEERPDLPDPWPHTEFRVRVVEPQPQAREALLIRLSRWGVPFEVAGDAWSGKPVYLILAAEGVDLDPKNTPIPVVQVCPMHLLRDPQALSKQGFAGLLRKPVLAHELRSLLDQAVEGRAWLGAESTPRKQATPSEKGKLRVLVGEDNPLHQVVAQGLLEGLGAEVVLAGDGQEVLREAAEGSFDVILLDGQMPVLDGPGTARALRREGIQTPLLAMTAHALPGDRERFLTSGMNGFLTKPFGRKELAEALQIALPEFPGVQVDVGAMLDPNGTIEEATLRAEAQVSPEAIRQVLALYCVHAPSQMAELRRAIARGDLRVTAETAHVLAGSAACIRATGLAQWGRRLELLAGAGDETGVHSALPALEAAYREVWASLEPLVASLEHPERSGN